MKKLSYLLGLFLVAGMIFSSCSKDEDEVIQDLTPIITYVTGAGFTSADITITQGDSILVGVLCTSNAISSEKLESFRTYMIVDNNPQSNIIDSADINSTTFGANYYITFPDVVTGNLFAEITDKDGEKSNVSFKVTVEAGTTLLGAEEDLEWKREYGAAGIGLDVFGLKWTSNAKETFAQIEKANDTLAAEKFVQLTAEEWTSIITIEDLTAAVEAATDMELYEGISTTVAHDDYDEVLATKYNGEYFIIHLESSTIEVDPTLGSIITIFGKSKK
ncbi:MAG: hypothetical protein DRJ05_10575 [Bacteroidetes bacterium]|nr:MAG: hypothetical protein DRJ05_10575 [Bacteroidota bacterium]